MNDGPDAGRFVGVDGCGDGWFVAAIEGGAVETEILPDFTAVWAEYDDAEGVLVDVPIGIPEGSYRQCDEQARTLLGSRWQSVFRTPIGDALAHHPDRRDAPGSSDDPRVTASERQQAATGTKISVQTWNVAPLILELDDFVRERDGLPATLREAHPEVTFWSLNDAQPVGYAKSTDAGLERRLDLLVGAAEVDVRAAYDEARDRFRKREASDDDVADALALAVAASRPDDLVTLPFFAADDRDPIDLVRAAAGAVGDDSGVHWPDDESPTDEAGIPMEIAFPRPEPSWLPPRSGERPAGR